MKNFITFALLTIIFLSQGCSSKYKNDRDLSQKEVFKIGFPKTLSFRADRAGIKEGYDFWENYHLKYNSITKKYLTEEVDIDPMSARIANQFAEKHPEKLMIVHLNGESTNVKFKETHEDYFPGHWIYETGSMLAEDIDTTRTKFKVISAKPFTTKAYAIHGNAKIVGRLPHNILLVKLDRNGKRLWYESEYATIDTIDYENNTITVRRGEYFSTKRNFVAGETYVAPLAGDAWANNLQWYFNLSSDCPVDKNGRTCADVWLENIKEWFSEDGILRKIDGIGFDVNYFVMTHHPTWDCDNDGIADAGVVDGKNIFRTGDWQFLKDLRKTFGDEFFILADGWRDEMQRGVGIMNGMESEGLCRPNDAYRQISRTINQHTYWNMYNTAKYKFSYITNKISNPLDADLSPQLIRMGIGVATCLGVGYTSIRQPEFNAGNMNKLNWMGQPVSDLIFPIKTTPDLLNGAGKEMRNDLIKTFDFGEADNKVENKTLYIKGKKKDTEPYTNLSVPGPEVTLPSGGDLVVFLEAKAVDGLHDFEPTDRVPRKINVRINGEPGALLPGETPQMISFHKEISGFMGTPGFTPMNFYFRKVGKEGVPIRLTIEVEEQGEFAIRNMTVHSAPLVMAREFENGMVLVNTSFDAYDFNLGELVKTGTKYQKINTVVQPVDSGQADSSEEMSYNNGEEITDWTRVSVPGLNALFLVKK